MVVRGAKSGWIDAVEAALDVVENGLESQPAPSDQKSITQNDCNYAALSSPKHK